MPVKYFMLLAITVVALGIGAFMPSPDELEMVDTGSYFKPSADRYDF